MAQYSNNSSSIYLPIVIGEAQTLPAECAWPTEGQPSLDAFRARLLPQLPPEYLEPLVRPTRGIFGWFKRRRDHCIKRTSPTGGPFRYDGVRAN